MIDNISMNATAHSHGKPPTRINMCQPSSSQSQRGVVLLITIIVLAIISLLTITTVRNASSTESVSGNVRITELATQASELALRHCERSLLDILTTESGTSSTYSTTFESSNILDVKEPANWQRADRWDSSDATSSGDVYVLPLDLVNQAAFRVTYQRPPECMVERLTAMLGGNSQPGEQSSNTSFLITSRGFGPEVAATDAARARPVGSEIWLQSELVFNR